MFRIIMTVFYLGVTVSGLSQTSITFRINMTDPYKKGLLDTVAGDRVLLGGSFCDWTGFDYMLEDKDGDLVFSGDVILEGDTGTVIEYKYAVLNPDGKVFYETKANPDNLPYGNRILTIGGEPVDPPTGVYITNPYRLGSIGLEVKFPVDELQEDFLKVRQTLEENHGCIYAFTSKEAFDSLFDHQYRLIDRPMSPSEYFRVLTPLTEKVGCGHTNLWMPVDFWDMDPDNLFPLQIRILEGHVVVSGSYTDSVQVPVGSIIHKINNRSAMDIYREMKANYSADGYNPNFKRTSGEQRFPMIYARRFGFPDEYRVQYTIPGAEIKEEIILNPATLQAVRKVVFGTHDDPELSLKLLEENNTAIMTINTFIYYDRVDYFKGFLDSCFTLIKEKNMKNLILDLRKNDGGDPFCSVPLFSYLEHEPVPYFAEPYGRYAEFSNPIPLAEKRFTGNLYTLLDGRCFSTNGHFCALLKYHKIGKFVGTPSGATYTCNAGRDLMVYLNNTRFMLYFGRTPFAVAVEGMDQREPIKPDYPVQESIQELLDGRDVYLETVMELIEAGEW